MKRVLIVDDALDLGRLLQDTLKTVHPDIPISVVPSGEEALLESSRFTIDLLVADLRLPGMSGLELIRKLRVRQPNVKVIMITGLSMDDALTRQKDEARPDVFIHKPITISVFLEAVEQLIGDGLPPKPALSHSQPVEEEKSRPAQRTVLQEISGGLPGEPVEAVISPEPVHKLTETKPVPEALKEEEGFSAVLSRLRSTLGALSAVLLDDHGRLVAQSGDFPDLSLENQLASPMMAAVSAGAKISYVLGQVSNQSVQGYRGKAFDLIVAPVGQYTLALALTTGPSVLRLALAFEEALSAQSELAALLKGMGLHVQSSVEVGAPEVLFVESSRPGTKAEEALPLDIKETPLGKDPGLKKLEELFTGHQTGQLRLPDADDFWNSAAEQQNANVSQPGMLSFEQARKLGLLPPDQQE